MCPSYLASFTWHVFKAIHAVAGISDARSNFLHSWIIFYWTGTPYFVYSFMGWWIFGLFLPFDYYKQSYHEYSVQVFWTRVFNPFAEVFIPGGKLLGYMIILCLTFWGTSTLLSTALYHFTFPPAVHKDSSFSISFQTLVIFLFFLNGHSSGHDVSCH